ncbi:MAG: PIN domain-containing protein [Acidobacteria bacterium]|nr:PIN domain-containing protein [Acidobacteriota bacterium]MBV9067691.1 PIN domain-containing protein [Acidobacteriota bacterium]MBV9185748.1 PIN domain-containing protein [Acidobacteriota bacterium]
MKTALLDLNILTALLWPAHEHHEAAHRWFATRRSRRWATCAITELGLIRLITNASFSRDALAPSDALVLLASNLADEKHDFWSEDLSVAEALDALPRKLQGHKQVTDAYLLALADHHHGVLATFDRGIETLAAGWAMPALEMVSTRI